MSKIGLSTGGIRIRTMSGQCPDDVHIVREICTSSGPRKITENLGKSRKVVRPIHHTFKTYMFKTYTHMTCFPRRDRPRKKRRSSHPPHRN